MLPAKGSEPVVCSFKKRKSVRNQRGVEDISAPNWGFLHNTMQKKKKNTERKLQKRLTFFKMWFNIIKNPPNPRSAVLGLCSIGKPSLNLLFSPQMMNWRVRGKCPSQCPQLGNSSAGAHFQVFWLPSLYSLSCTPPISYGSTDVSVAVWKGLSDKMWPQKKWGLFSSPLSVK